MTRIINREFRSNIIHYVAPAVLTNACAFLFSVVDGLFVGNGVGTEALASVNICVPFVTISIALNMLSSIGGITIGAVRIGSGDKDGANKVFMHALSGSLVLGILITLIGTLGCGPVASVLGATENYYQMTKDYLLWWSLFAIPNFLSVNLQGFCRNDGEPGLVAVATVVGTLMNVFLDWLLVYPMQKGVAGAAIATGISQVVTLLIILTHFVRKRGILRFHRFRSAKKLYLDICFRGMPEMIAQFSSPIMTLWMNRSLGHYIGDIGLNSFSVISYISSLTLTMLFGASEGMQPLLGRSYGAKKEKDLRVYFRAGILISMIGSAIIIALFCIFDAPAARLFGARGEVLDEICIHILPFSWGFVFAGANSMISSYLYSTMHSKSAILLNIIRSFVTNTFAILVLPMIFGESIIWYTYGISEIMVSVIAIIILRSFHGHMIEELY